MRWILTDHAKARQRDKRRAGLALPLIKEIRWLGSRKKTLSIWTGRCPAGGNRFPQDEDSGVARLPELHGEETAEIMGLSKATVDREMRLACAWLCRELRPEK